MVNVLSYIVITGMEVFDKIEFFSDGSFESERGCVACDRRDEVERVWSTGRGSCTRY